MNSNSLHENAESLKSNLQLIIEEHRTLISKVNYEELSTFTAEIQQAKRIFLMGISLAMRLMHLGFAAIHVVGEITSPAIGEGDLLILASGSGSTSNIVRAAEKAVSVKAKVICFTTNIESPMAKLAKKVLYVPAAHKLEYGERASKQYAGSLFEQSLLLIGDAIFMTLWNLSEISAENLFKRHANLE